MEDSKDPGKPQGNPLLYGHNAFVSTWAANASAPSGPVSKTMARSRSTIEHKGSHETALKDAAEAAASDFHARDDSRQFEDAARCLVLPPGNVHAFSNELAQTRAAAYEVRWSAYLVDFLVGTLAVAGSSGLCRRQADSQGCGFSRCSTGSCN